MARDDPQMKLRLPAELKEQIEGAAKASGRSINSEIVKRLEETVSRSPYNMLDYIGFESSGFIPSLSSKDAYLIIVLKDYRPSYTLGLHKDRHVSHDRIFEFRHLFLKGQVEHPKEWRIYGAHLELIAEDQLDLGHWPKTEGAGVATLHLSKKLREVAAVLHFPASALGLISSALGEQKFRYLVLVGRQVNENEFLVRHWRFDYDGKPPEEPDDGYEDED